MMPGSGQLTVPPGFRFHPTDEELLYYYLRKKVSFEAIDLDVIREVDLNKLEPWDLKDKCRIGSGPQNEWYFFSHKDNKYPTGTRTNRATRAGFWKATGRDKGIYYSSNSKKIGMRKTLVFYTGRAPHGHKTEWIMHEYRLDEDDAEVQEDGWVVCRVFKKKNQNRGYQQEIEEEEENFTHNMRSSSGPFQPQVLDPKHHHMQGLYDYNNFDGSMHLPQLFNPESAVAHNNNNPSMASSSMNALDILECSQNLLRLTTTTHAGCGLNLMQQQPGERFSGDWSFLDKLLASHNSNPATHQAATTVGTSAQKFPFHYLGCDTHDIMKFSK